MSLLPTEATELLARYRKVLLELTMLSQVRSGWDFDRRSDVSRAKPGTKAPPRAEDLVTKEIERLEEFVRGAEIELQRSKRRPPGMIPDYHSWAKFVVDTYRGELAVVVADEENCSEALVKKVRKQAGVGLMRGEPIPKVAA